jgi:hypothetical protein
MHEADGGSGVALVRTSGRWRSRWDNLLADIGDDSAASLLPDDDREVLSAFLGCDVHELPGYFTYAGDKSEPKQSVVREVSMPVVARLPRPLVRWAFSSPSLWCRGDGSRLAARGALRPHPDAAVGPYCQSLQGPGHGRNRQ